MKDGECTCLVRRDGYVWNCETHVSCDDGCMAMVNPVTFEEYKAAYEHWRSHHDLRGCSHGG